MKSILVRLDDEVAEELRKAAYLGNTTKTAIIREAVEAWLSRRQGQETDLEPRREAVLAATKYLLKVAERVGQGWTLSPPAAANGSAPAKPAEEPPYDDWDFDRPGVH